MNRLFLNAFTVITLLVASCSEGGSTAKKDAKADSLYTCLPCGFGCDSLTYTSKGTCSHCNMQLVEKSTIRFGSVQPEELCGYINQKGAANIVLLDVRTPEEFNGTAPDKFGKLADAINIPVQQLPQRVNELEKFKNSEIIVYCSHSHRSPAASYILGQNGFTKVSNLTYGMSEWKNRVTDTGCNSKLYIPQ